MLYCSRIFENDFDLFAFILLYVSLGMAEAMEMQAINPNKFSNENQDRFSLQPISKHVLVSE